MAYVKHELFPSASEEEQRFATSPVIPNVIQATRLTVVFVAMGLGFVIISLAVPVWIGVIFEYTATYAFILALAVTRSGIWEAETVWWHRASITTAAKWIIGLTLIAALSGLVELYGHDFVDALKTFMATAFSSLTLLVVGCYVYMFNKNSSKNAGARESKPRLDCFGFPF